MKKYIIDYKNETDYTAGSKARMDISEILKSYGYKTLYITIGSNKKRIFREVERIKRQIPAVFSSIEEESIVLFQYPWPTLSFKIAEEIGKYARNKRIWTIVLIHDLNSVRTGSKVTKIYYDYYVKEIKYLNTFDRIICHNEKMKQYLISNGIHKGKIVPLGLFDYIGNPSDQHVLNYHVVNIAGNLRSDKTGYAYHLNSLDPIHYEYHLYGTNYSGGSNDKVVYKGKYAAEVLPGYLNEGFGLVWDGPSCMNCDGSFGRYMEINNPHKLSLYIASGIPVFIWAKAAEADFVIKNKIGFAISSLEEIDSIISNLTDEMYRNLLENVANIQKSVLSGKYTLTAVKKAEND